MTHTWGNYVWDKYTMWSTLGYLIWAKYFTAVYSQIVEGKLCGYSKFYDIRDKFLTAWIPHNTSDLPILMSLLILYILLCSKILVLICDWYLKDQLPQIVAQYRESWPDYVLLNACLLKDSSWFLVIMSSPLSSVYLSLVDLCWTYNYM